MHTKIKGTTGGPFTEFEKIYSFLEPYFFFLIRYLWKPIKKISYPLKKKRFLKIFLIRSQKL